MVTVNCKGRFHSVGQGLFHSTRLEFAREDAAQTLAFNCVYDCGASGPQIHVNREIERFLEFHTDGVDGLKVLMLSHLHWDHVSGLRNLLQAVSMTHTAILPYLYPAERALVLATAIEEGDFPSDDSDWYVEFLTRPAQFLIENGTRNVVFVRGNDEELDEEVYVPHFPDLGEQLPEDFVFTSEPQPVDAGVLTEVQESELAVGGDTLGSGVQLVTSSRPIGVGMWQNFLFNRRPDPMRLRRFRLEFESIRDGSDLGALLGERAKMTELKRSYERIFGMRRMNETSMAVFSGIIKWSQYRSLWRSVSGPSSVVGGPWRYWPDDECPWKWLSRRAGQNEVLGVAFTGDLTVPEIWESLSSKFLFGEGLWRGRAMFYQVPHHGSR